MVFMQEGGWAMWLMVFVAVAGVVGEALGRRTALPSAVAVVAISAAGFGTGLWAVNAFVSQLAPADQAPTTLIGLREASNNLVLGGGLGTALALLAALGSLRPGAAAR